jgi:hypothetical protein
MLELVSPIVTRRSFTASEMKMALLPYPTRVSGPLKERGRQSTHFWMHVTSREIGKSTRRLWIDKKVAR